MEELQGAEAVPEGNVMVEGTLPVVVPEIKEKQSNFYFNLDATIYPSRIIQRTQIRKKRV